MIGVISNKGAKTALEVYEMRKSGMTRTIPEFLTKSLDGKREKNRKSLMRHFLNEQKTEAEIDTITEKLKPSINHRYNRHSPIRPHNPRPCPALSLRSHSGRRRQARPQCRRLPTTPATAARRSWEGAESRHQSSRGILRRRPR